MKEFCYVTESKSSEGGIYIDSSFNPDFVGALKDHVPAGERKWDPELKRWWVSDRYARQAMADARGFFEDVHEC